MLVSQLPNHLSVELQVMFRDTQRGLSVALPHSLLELYWWEGDGRGEHLGKVVAEVLEQ